MHPDIISNLYFETHVTIEPIFDERLSEAGEIANKHGFRVASLLMKKRETDTEERSQYDTFMTGHGKSLNLMKANVTSLVNELNEKKFKVWRYKIEDTVMDSRTNDEMGLLNGFIKNTKSTDSSHTSNGI
jgi:hypothetical protein